MSKREKAPTAKPESKNAVERWISYRPEIKVLDCTIRDGGLMNHLAKTLRNGDLITSFHGRKTA